MGLGRTGRPSFTQRLCQAAIDALAEAFTENSTRFVLFSVYPAHTRRTQINQVAQAERKGTKIRHHRTSRARYAAMAAILHTSLVSSTLSIMHEPPRCDGQRTASHHNERVGTKPRQQLPLLQHQSRTSLLVASGRSNQIFMQFLGIATFHLLSGASGFRCVPRSGTMS